MFHFNDFLNAMVIILIFIIVSVIVYGVMTIIDKIRKFSCTIDDLRNTVIKTEYNVNKAVNDVEKKFDSALSTVKEDVHISVSNAKTDFSWQLAQMRVTATEEMRNTLVNLEKDVNEVKVKTNLAVNDIKETANYNMAAARINIEQEAIKVTHSANNSISGLTGVVADTACRVRDAAIGVSDAVNYVKYIGIAFAVLALGRQLYYRIMASSKEKKEALTENKVFKIFDALALVLVAPLFCLGGAGNFMSVWRTVKSVIVMVRDFCGGFHAFASIFGGRKDEPAFLGENLSKEIEEVADEVVGRVEVNLRKKEEQQVRKRKLVGKKQTLHNFSNNLPINTNWYARAEALEHIFTMAEANDWDAKKIQEEVEAYDVSVAGGFNENNVEVQHEDKHEPAMGEILKAYTEKHSELNKEAWEGIDKLYTTVSDVAEGGKTKEHFDPSFKQRVQGYINKYPWLLPCVVLFLVCVIILTIRLLKKTKEQEKKERKSSKPKKKQIALAKKAKWWQVSGSSKQEEENPQERYYTDDDGIFAQFMGPDDAASMRGTNPGSIHDFGKGYGLDDIDFREALLSRTILLNKSDLDDMDGFNQAYVRDGDQWVYYKMVRRHELPKDTEVRHMPKGYKFGKMYNKESLTIKDFKEKYLTKCTNPKCNKSCGKFHVVKKKDPVKTTMKEERKCPYCKVAGHSPKDCPVLKKQNCKFSQKTCPYGETCGRVHTKVEALVNGGRFKTDHCKLSAGIAKCNGDMTNCTFIWGGVVVAKHLMEEHKENVIICRRDKELSIPQNKFYQIGHDIMFTKIPQNTVLGEFKSAKACVFNVGDKCQLVAYDSEADFDKDVLHNDSSIVSELNLTPMRERGVTQYSSVNGNCTAQVVNEFGHVGGFHIGTGTSYTTFVPITENMVKLATGKLSEN